MRMANRSTSSRRVKMAAMLVMLKPTWTKTSNSKLALTTGVEQETSALSANQEAVTVVATFVAEETAADEETVAEEETAAEEVTAVDEETVAEEATVGDEVTVVAEVTAVDEEVSANHVTAATAPAEVVEEARKRSGPTEILRSRCRSFILAVRRQT